MFVKPSLKDSKYVNVINVVYRYGIYEVIENKNMRLCFGF